ncbi:MAG: WD40 repeat domain-containing protein [Thermoplasmatota archaeon]
MKIAVIPATAFGLLILLLPLNPAAAQVAEIDPARAEVIWMYTKEDSEATFWKLSWSPDGSMIAATFFDDKCVVLNATDGGIRTVLDLVPEDTRCDGFSPEGTNPLRACCFSPDGKLLAVGGDDRIITVFDTATWEEKYMLRGHSGSILCLDFSPDSRYLASGSGRDKVIPQNQEENAVRIWDMQTGRLYHTLNWHRDGVLAVRWSNEGDRLASASDDRMIRIMEFSTRTEVMNATGHTTGVLDIDWSPDDSRLITGSRDYKIKVWNSSTGEILATWSDNNCVRSVDFHPFQEIAATSGVDLTLKIRDSVTGTELKVIKDGMEQHAMVMMSRWSPDGRFLASGLGKSHTVILYGFGGEAGEGDGLPIGTITAVSLIIIGAAALVAFFYPAYREIRRSRG